MTLEEANAEKAAAEQAVKVTQQAMDDAITANYEANRRLINAIIKCHELESE